MGVKVTESGVMVSRVVARQTINGREFPIRKSGVAEVGTVIPDSELNDRVIEFAKAGERGFEYVEDDSSPVQDVTGEGSDGDPVQDEPVEGYAALNSGDAKARYESEQDPAVKEAILKYELAHDNRAWAQKAKDENGGGTS